MTENKGDLISREALKATIIEPLNVNDACKNDWYEGYYTAKNEDIMAIDNAPTVEPICEDKACKYRANERPQTIDCTNCKYESKRLIEEPCTDCNRKYSEWEAKEE